MEKTCVGYAVNQKCGAHAKDVKLFSIKIKKSVNYLIIFYLERGGAMSKFVYFSVGVFVGHLAKDNLEYGTLANYEIPVNKENFTVSIMYPCGWKKKSNGSSNPSALDNDRNK